MQAHERRDGPQPQQQSSHGALPQLQPFSTQDTGKDKTPNMDVIVHGVGQRATSLPPMETIKISLLCMLSLRKRSWGRNILVRSFRVVASTIEKKNINQNM